jgi:hypothetical protein
MHAPILMQLIGPVGALLRQFATYADFFLADDLAMADVPRGCQRR